MAFGRPLPAYSAACCALVAIFETSLLPRLPLHIGRRVRAAGAERLDMIDDPAGAGAGAPSGRRTVLRMTEGESRPTAASAFRPRRIGADSERRGRQTGGKAPR